MATTSDSPLVMPADRFESDQKEHRSNNSKLEDFGNVVKLGLVPIGGIIGYGGNAAPQGFLNCNGAAVSRRDYAGLFSIVGTLWGVGDGSTTFNVPTFVQARSIFGGTAAAPTNGILIIRTGAY